ncbi:MAG: sigma-70 family RNA polymerase sigma factor [Isosphaeraceae bacterium]|nr:sigma-70 family RNA polymerase sigma factor [Isosphaeraceae bacterium]
MPMADTERWFLEQVERSHVRLRAYIRSMGVRAEEVDDLAQEVFLLCWEKFNEFDREGHFDAWVRQIGRRLIANERRKELRRSRLLSDHVTELLLDGDGPVENPSYAGYDTEQELSALRECMSEMPKASRELLRQRYFEELSPGAIGGLLGKSSNQVRQSLLRLRRALLLCLKTRLQMSDI